MPKTVVDFLMYYLPSHAERMMKTGIRSMVLAGLASAALGSAAAGQAAATGGALKAGSQAPGFSLRSATRTGIGGEVSLDQFKDKTIVIAFFFKARTRG